MKDTQEYHTFQGTVQRMKVIKAEDPTMVYVELVLENQETLNALVVRNALTFMLDVVEGDKISIHGHFNKRHQFVVRKYLTVAKFDHLTEDLPPHLTYPRKKSD